MKLLLEMDPRKFQLLYTGAPESAAFRIMVEREKQMLTRLHYTQRHDQR